MPSVCTALPATPLSVFLDLSPLFFHPIIHSLASLILQDSALLSVLGIS